MLENVTTSPHPLAQATRSELVSSFFVRSRWKGSDVSIPTRHVGHLGVAERATWLFRQLAQNECWLEQAISQSVLCRLDGADRGNHRKRGGARKSGGEVRRGE